MAYDKNNLTPKRQLFIDTYLKNNASEVRVVIIAKILEATIKK